MTTGEIQKLPSIDDGLPVDRESWPVGVLNEMAKFAQGDIVADPPFFYFADPDRPVWKRTAAYVDGHDGPELIEMPEGANPRYGLITTQTCDLVEEEPYPAVKPWVQIAPVEERSDLDGGIRKLLRQGKGPLHYLYMDALPDGFWVADLRIEMPVEKGWLAGRTPIAAFGHGRAGSCVGERIAKIRCRPAFAKTFVDAIQLPLGDSLKILQKEDAAMFHRMDEQVSEVAIELDDYLAPSVARVTLITEGELDDEVAEWWRSWWDTARSVGAQHNIILQSFEARALSSVRLSEYRRMTTLPLLRVSPG
ncbi:hypothetical protein [Actinokineospora xionganensis]|uniref:Uncharacterized protein n=1 Tax=Actinokineospora xionganensis TaxID=2684470 RepID=A0ABR7LDE5_9PSEU|nr:hypothetical protein [Actinokineospora xionganensis]MBC6450684.1 hypothetical protein [Actinokineospora xionganensis]